MKPRFLLPLALLCAPLAGQQPADVKTPPPILPPKPVKADRETGLPPAAAPALPAKKSAAGVATRSRVPEDLVLVDRPGDGRIWARARSYKASFDGAGATYIPFLGADAPRNFPVGLRLRSVRVGSEPVAFKAHGEATTAERRVSIDRGTLVETYDLHAKGMEQSFTFQTLPAVGDLVVQIGVTTELLQSGDRDELRFANDLGEVRYGAAFLVDASGERTPMQSTFEDGAIQLRAPAGFLATAVFPVTVDPMVSTFTAASAAVREFDSDIAYDQSQAQYLIVWEEAFSAVDHDIASVRHDRDGNPIAGSLAYIDQSSTNWSHPRVANLRAARRFLVVGEYSLAPNREIWGRTREAASSFLSAQFALSVNGGIGDKSHPDVGGDAGDTGSGYWTVVWERTYSPTDSDILGQQIDALGGYHGGLIPIANSGGTHETRPSIAKSNGSGPRGTQGWTVVWQYTYVPGDEDVWFARINWDGTVTTPATVLDFSEANHTNPTVSSPTDDANGRRRWMACWEHPIAAGNRDIAGCLCEGAQVVQLANLSLLDSQQQAAADQFLPQVDTDGSRFTVLWVEPFASQATDLDVLGSTYHVVYGQALGVTDARISPANTAAAEERPSITAAHGAGDHRYGFTWDVRHTATHVNIEGAINEGLGLGGFTPLFTGCGGLGMATSGGTSLGEIASFQMTGVGANAPVMMFGLRLDPLVTVCSTCLLGLKLETATFVAGSSLGVRIPAEGAFVGGLVAVQGFTYGVGPCLGSIKLSDTVLLMVR